MNQGKKFLSDLKLHSDYLRWLDSENRYETWEEAIDSIVEQHRIKYAGIDIEEELRIFEQHAKQKKVLASQRNLQWRGKDVFKKNARIFNCTSTYCDRPEVFKQIMYLLLCGCGVGYSVERRFINKLPTIKKRKDTAINFHIGDSIEGWAEAIDMLMDSFFKGGPTIRFIYSNIRPKGSLVAGRFLAPGPEPLKMAIERVEKILEFKEDGDKLTSLECHDIICHIADACISSGLRRSALIALFDKDDYEMAECKTGNWFIENPQRARANNSAKLINGQYTKEDYDYFANKIKQFGEPGFVLVDDERFCTNPCVEIGFIPINPKTGNSAISFCNLCEINATGIKTKQEFLNRVEAATIIGTLQAGYTDFPFLGKDTEELTREEALLGVSITGWFDNPILFNSEWLEECANFAKTVNEKLAAKIGINPSARITCTKPSGNASVILGTSSGIHPAHSRNYFRVMQINKDSNVAKWLAENRPEMIEESVWSANKSDYVVYVPITESDTAITKEDISSIEHLEKVKLAQKSWVIPGTIKGRGYSDTITHNISNTIVVDDWDETFQYVWDNREYFCGISFLPKTGDKIYRQAPFTSVLTAEELLKKYNYGVLFASGLIVDILNAFDNDLWTACDAIMDKSFFLSGSNLQVLAKKDVIRRAKKFAKNYFKNELSVMIDCLKDVHLFHKWCSINRKSINIDVAKVLGKPDYLNLNEMTAASCNGGACEV